MNINQGEDDGHQWCRILIGSLSIELHHYSPEYMLLMMNDETKVWKGPYSASITSRSEIEKYLVALEKFVEDVRHDLKHPYNG